MKRNISKRLLNGFKGLLESERYQFVYDSDSSCFNMCILKRKSPTLLWEFVSLVLGEMDNSFDIEVAYSRSDEYPLHILPTSDDSCGLGDCVRFRASQMWPKSNKCRGWLIADRNRTYPSFYFDGYLTVFFDETLAVDYLCKYILSHIIPYFEKLRRKVE